MSFDAERNPEWPEPLHAEARQDLEQRISGKLLKIADRISDQTSEDFYQTARTKVVDGRLIDLIDLAVEQYDPLGVGIDPSARMYPTRKAAQLGLVIGAFIGSSLLSRNQRRERYFTYVGEALTTHLEAAPDGRLPLGDIVRQGASTAQKLESIDNVLTSLDPPRSNAQEIIFAHAVGYTCNPAITIMTMNAIRATHPPSSPIFRSYVNNAKIPNICPTEQELFPVDRPEESD